MVKKKKERSASPKLGAQYQAAKLAVQIAGPPVYDLVTRKGDPQAAIVVLKHTPYQKSVAVALLDAYGSKKIRHANALSRKSLTAWAPEVYAWGVRGAVEGNFDPADTYGGGHAATNGYDPRNGAFDVKRAKEYGLLKYGGALARKLLNATGIAKPIEPFLSSLGVTK